ncbi:hypothetical protein PMIN01_09203 [Paraphaeosphaeria minitans]|uniref:Uncharacterized protein n=1 Tax=Paraphaeosphaeria minitans TaxID=565426 RepID=A0A9P6GC74_9PLEO|nr:hypothetical protein PMIN01_09203 [Paraphaeosphaeria minitans]
MLKCTCAGCKTQCSSTKRLSSPRRSGSKVSPLGSPNWPVNREEQPPGTLDMYIGIENAIQIPVQ